MVHYRDRYAEVHKLPQKAVLQVGVSDPSTMTAIPRLPVNTYPSGHPENGKGTRDDASYVNQDQSGNTVQFKSITQSGNVGVPIELRDYIQDAFPLSAKKSKTFNDLAGGFGDGPQGKFVFRPSLFKHKSFSSSNSSGLNTHYFLKTDPVRGARFGLMNTNPLRRKYVYSRSSFGQQKDKFEQPLDSQIVSSVGDPQFGSPIVFESKNPRNPSVDLPVVQNTRRNRDRHQRIVYPYFDEKMKQERPRQPGELTATVTNSSHLAGPDLSGVLEDSETLESYNSSGDIQPTINAAPTATVNVVGAIASSAVTVGPGSLRNLSD